MKLWFWKTNQETQKFQLFKFVQAVKGTDMQTEKALINDRSCVSKIFLNISRSNYL